MYVCHIVSCAHCIKKKLTLICGEDSTLVSWEDKILVITSLNQSAPFKIEGSPL